MPYFLSNRNIIGQQRPNPLNVNYVGGSSSASSLSGIFTGSATTFTYGWNNRWTAIDSQPSTGWQNITGNANHFVSGFGITAVPTSSNIGRFDPSLLTTYTNSNRSLTSVTAPQGASSSYTVSEALNFSSSTNGAWLESIESRTLVFTFGSGATDFGNATGFIVQSFSNGGYHKCLVMSITHSGITRLFAPKGSVITSTGTAAPYIFYPLNNTFTSYTDSRLTSASGPTLDPTYFEY